LIFEIIEDKNFPAHATVGDKATKFIPMRRELSDERYNKDCGRCIEKELA
jgi:2'-5' RNA ligase